MKGIIWLASYPKSGNTWMRTFISNYMSEKDEPVNINELNTDGIASGRKVFEDMVGVESSYLAPDEIDKLRPEVYVRLSEETDRTLFVKVHDAYIYIDKNMPLIPTKNCKFIYIARNPLDVAVSLSFHIGKSIEKTVDKMCDENFCFGDKSERYSQQFRQKLLSWTGHVESFLNNKSLDLKLIRYEDMKSNPLKTFTEVVEFCELDMDEKRIKKAIEFSDFKVLKKQEQETGFKERSIHSENFFREGKTGSWKDKLTEKQIQKIIDKNKKTMEKLGYLLNNEVNL